MGTAAIEINCDFISRLFCLDGETEVTVKGKENSYKKPISEVEKGEYVLTYNGNELVYSKVKDNKKQEGQRAFFNLKVKVNQILNLFLSLIIIQLLFITKKIMSLHLNMLPI